MIILGLNYFFHDSTACIVNDGKLLAAIEEERLTRHKHTGAFPVMAIKKCLEITGLSYNDIDSVAVSIKPDLNWLSKLMYGLVHAVHAAPFLKHEVLATYNKQANLWSWYKKTWPDKQSRPQIFFIPHHLAHAVGSFFVSPYDTAALLSLDGSGEWASSFLGKGEGIRFVSFMQSFFPISLGLFYEAATEFCGFRPNYDEGKTMGLAPLGNADTYWGLVKDIVKVDHAGRLSLNLSYFNYQYWGHQRCSEKFHRTFGAARRKNEQFEQHHLDVAAAFQKTLEERVLELCRILRTKTGCRYLVVSGGVSLNSVMNGRIIRESGFDDIYVMPAAGDNGTAIGAAYFLYNGILGNRRHFVHDDPYVGNRYSDEEIERVIRECKLRTEKFSDIASVAARYLSEGKIIGWYQGRMEIGPRALGNRSILADPTRKNMKDKINAEVKHRESFRPFAPSVPVEYKNDFFDINVDSPFMLKVCDVKTDKRESIPAVTHVDGSARVQTVSRDTNELYHNLLTQFGKITGVPVLLNTSFNIMGEPIVESPIDAIRCFYSTGLDALAIGNFMITKDKGV